MSYPTENETCKPLLGDFPFRKTPSHTHTRVEQNQNLFKKCQQVIFSGFSPNKPASINLHNQPAHCWLPVYSRPRVHTQAPPVMYQVNIVDARQSVLVRKLGGPRSHSVKCAMFTHGENKMKVDNIGCGDEKSCFSAQLLTKYCTQQCTYPTLLLPHCISIELNWVFKRKHFSALTTTTVSHNNHYTCLLCIPSPSVRKLLSKPT